jgi:hypothetical protein
VKPAHSPEEQPTIAAVLGIGRLEDEQQLDRVEGGRPVAPGEVRGPEVPEDPREDLAAPDHPEHPGVEQDSLAHAPPDQGLAVVQGEEATAAGRVEQGPLGSADDEVAGQPDPAERQPDPPGDLELDDREADRQADPALQHPIEVAVRRLAVLGRGRAAEPGFAVEDVMEPGRDDLVGVARVGAEADQIGQLVEATEDRALVDGRPAVARDDQGRRRQGDVRVRAGDDPRETGATRVALVIRERTPVGHLRILDREGHPSIPGL